MDQFKQPEAFPAEYKPYDLYSFLLESFDVEIKPNIQLFTKQINKNDSLVFFTEWFISSTNKVCSSMLEKIDQKKFPIFILGLFHYIKALLDKKYSCGFILYFDHTCSAGQIYSCLSYSEKGLQSTNVNGEDLYYDLYSVFRKQFYLYLKEHKGLFKYGSQFSGQLNFLFDKVFTRKFIKKIVMPTFYGLTKSSGLKAVIEAFDTIEISWSFLGCGIENPGVLFLKKIIFYNEITNLLFKLIDIEFSDIMSYYKSLQKIANLFIDNKKIC